jgi:hypothetical protein
MPSFDDASVMLLAAFQRSKDEFCACSKQRSVPLSFRALEAPESIKAALSRHLGHKILLVCLACAMGTQKKVRQEDASVIHTV